MKKKMFCYEFSVKYSFLRNTWKPFCCDSILNDRLKVIWIIKLSDSCMLGNDANDNFIRRCCDIVLVLWSSLEYVKVFAVHISTWKTTTLSLNSRELLCLRYFCNPWFKSNKTVIYMPDVSRKAQWVLTIENFSRLKI